MSAKPKRVSLDELCASVGASADEIEALVDELNRMVPPQVQAQYGPDYKLVTLHTDETTGERYALMHATVVFADSEEET